MSCSLSSLTLLSFFNNLLKKQLLGTKLLLLLLFLLLLFLFYFDCSLLLRLHVTKKVDTKFLNVIHKKLMLILSFRRVLIEICFLLGVSPPSEC
jgi:hypothetical protein